MTETLADTRAVVVERTLAHPPAKVWRALSERDLLARWIMPNDFQARPGHRFAFRTEPTPHWKGVVHCEVLEIEPQTRLVLRWGDGTPDEGGFVTTVTFTLSPDGAGSKLRMEQGPFTAEQEGNRKGAEFGWNRMMDAVAPVLESL